MRHLIIFTLAYILFSCSSVKHQPVMEEIGLEFKFDPDLAERTAQYLTYGKF